MPAISVIVPVYKVEPYLHRCVDSILNQTYRDFELILVDDGSPDNCGLICDEYAKQDRRVVVIHQENGGLSAARNAGIDWAFDNSDSEWITFVDSDDWVHPEYLERFLDAVKVHQTLICICNAAEQSFSADSNDYVPQKHQTEEAYCNDELKVNRINAWGKLYAKQLWTNIRFPVGKIHEDRFTTHKLLFQVPEVSNIVAPLYHYSVNQDSITHSVWTPKRMDDIEALEEQFVYFRENNLPCALLRTKKAALYVTANMLKEISCVPETRKKYSLYTRKLQKKLRKYISESKKELHLNLNEHCYLYESAYPRLMTLYWYYIAVLRKLKIST